MTALLEAHGLSLPGRLHGADLALAPGVRPHVLTRMFFDRDLGFLAWW